MSSAELVMLLNSLGLSMILIGLFNIKPDKYFWCLLIGIILSLIKVASS